MKIQVTVDQIEAGQARLLIRPQEAEPIIWPSQYLPTGTKESDILTIEIRQDPQATAEATERVKSLMDSLLQKNSKKRSD